MAITDNLTTELRDQYEAGPHDPERPVMLDARGITFMGYTEEELRAIVQHYQTMTGQVRTPHVYEPADRDQDIAVLREQQTREAATISSEELRVAAQKLKANAMQARDWEAQERENKEAYALEEEKAQAEYETREYAGAIGRIEGALGYLAAPSSPTPLPGHVTQAIAQAILDLLRRQMFLAERRRDEAEEKIRARLRRRD